MPVERYAVHRFQRVTELTTSPSGVAQSPPSDATDSEPSAADDTIAAPDVDPADCPEALSLPMTRAARSDRSRTRTAGRISVMWIAVLVGSVALGVAGCAADSADSTDPPRAPATTAPAASVGLVPTAPPPTRSPTPAVMIPAGLPSLDDPVPTYEWTGDDQPGRAELDRLAEALGVTGEVSKGGHGDADGWVLDGDNLTLWLAGGVEGAWTYSGPPPFAWPSETETRPTIETGEPVTVAPPPISAPGTPLPDSFPTPAAAEDLARQVVSALGSDPDAFEWRHLPDTFARRVEAWRIMDGVTSPVRFDFGFGPGGALVSASGQLVVPTAGPRAERVGVAAVEDRLRVEIDRARSEPPNAVVLTGGLVAAGVYDDSVVIDDPSVVRSDVSVETGPTATTPPPTTVAPDLVGGVVDVQQAWIVERSTSATRLIPAYTFIDATGQRYTVSALP